MLLCRQLPSRRISLLVAALRMNPRSTNCLTASLATFSEQLQCDGLDAGPAKFFLPGAADQIAVYRQRDRFQVIAEDGIAYLIESFTENRIEYLRVLFEIQRTKSCVPEASLLDCLQMESAFFGTRRAGGLLQQFRRLSFCCGPCTLITRTSFTKIRGPHAVPVPTLRPCLSRTAFPFALVGAPVA